MRKYITYLILLSLPLSQLCASADGLDQFQEESNTIWSPSDGGKDDTSQDAKIGTSMLAWGIGLSVAIALIFGLIKGYQSTQSSSTTTN